MKLECSVRDISPTRSGFVDLFIDTILQQLTKWINELIRLHELEQDVVSLSDMYFHVSVLLLSHTTGSSFQKTIDTLRHLGISTPSLERMRFVADNIVASSPTGRGRDCQIEWDSQRDHTRQLGEFKQLSF